MRRLMAVGLMLMGAGALADRSDVWSANSVKVYKVDLTKLADGGCAVAAFATYTLTDGGSQVAEGTASREVSGANRTDCLNILDTRAPVLFKAEKGL